MIIGGLCAQFKKDILLGVHDLDTDVIKLALYLESAGLSPATAVYSSTGEVSGTNYTAGGAVVTVSAPVISGTSVYVDISDLTFSGTVSLTARGALLYNSSKSDKAIAVLDFGFNRRMNNFTVIFPLPNIRDAIIRIN
jgi:hypothetical protein